MELIANALNFKVIKEDIELHALLYEELRKAGFDMLTRADSIPDKSNIELRLADVKNRWESLRAGIDERNRSLGKLVPSVFGYVEVRKEVITWLSESEKKFDELALGFGDVGDLTIMSQKQEQLKVTWGFVLLIYVFSSILARSLGQISYASLGSSNCDTKFKYIFKI